MEHCFGHVVLIGISCTSLFCCIPLQVPILTENLDASASKVCWSPSGQHLAAGDFEGKVHIFEAGEVSWRH